METSREDVARLLGLQTRTTCGWVNESFRSRVALPASVLPAGYVGDHSLGNILYFMVTPDAPVKLHRIRSDQMYHHYLGEPLEVLLLYADGRSETKTVGNDLTAGMRPQLLIPGGTFHSARLAPGSSYSLLATSVWIRAEPSDVEMGDVEQLTKTFPLAGDAILAFTS